MATRLEINKQDENTLQVLRNKHYLDNKTDDYRNLGMLYFNGTGGPFNYSKAIKYLDKRGHFFYSMKYELDSLPNNGTEIARIKLLKAIHFDELLNRLRSNALKDLASAGVGDASDEFITIQPEEKIPVATVVPSAPFN